MITWVDEDEISYIDGEAEWLDTQVMKVDDNWWSYKVDGLGIEKPDVYTNRDAAKDACVATLRVFIKDLQAAAGVV